MRGAAPLITTPIEPGDLTSGFRCGVRSLDDFFLRHAVPNDLKGLGKTFVLRDGTSGSAIPVLGYYTLSMADVEPDVVSDAMGSRLPRYPIPVALIGRLAVHEALHGQGVGGRLLGDALRRIVQASSHVGCVGVIVDAVDEKAEAFYSRVGFEVVTEGAPPRRMFLPMAMMGAALR